MNHAAQIATKSTALHINAATNTKKQNNKQVLRRMQRLSKINQKTKKEHKKASDAQTEIKKNLESILTSHLSKLENKIDQITKIANERLRNNFQSQIDQLKSNLQNIKKEMKKPERILGKQSFKTLQKYYVKH